MIETLVEFAVEVLDGEGMPVPDVEVGVRYRYPDCPRTWSAEHTDGDGWARFRDEHPEPPVEMTVFVDEVEVGTYPVTAGEHLTIEM